VVTSGLLFAGMLLHTRAALTGEIESSSICCMIDYMIRDGRIVHTVPARTR
jgi:hypothetical protein